MRQNLVEIRASVRQSIIAALAVVLLVVFAGACNKQADGNSSAGTAAALSPTDTVKAYFEAINKRDGMALKKYLSKASLDILEQKAKALGRTMDELLKEGPPPSAQPITPQYSNEKIDGDNATVDATLQGRTITIPLVKEGGEWKLAMDKAPGAGAPAGK
ncbi:MAG TPA: hypothetical protein VF791_01225 [Pyrinomonadaceae bacterium]